MTIIISNKIPSFLSLIFLGLSAITDIIGFKTIASSRTFGKTLKIEDMNKSVSLIADMDFFEIFNF